MNYTKPLLEENSATDGSRPTRQVLSDSLKRLESAYAENTLRAYRTDFEIFISWCDSVEVPALPATPETVAAFIFVDAVNAQSATVRRRIGAIARIHRLCRFPDPTKSEDVVLAMRRMHRQKGRRQKQALGMTASLRDQILTATGDDAKGLRDRVLLRLAYDTMRRRSELVHLLIEDLETRADGSGVILLRFSKTDQEGEGKSLAISKDTMVAYHAWLEKVPESAGPILREISRFGTIGKKLDAGSVPRIYKALARLAGLPQTMVDAISGHSGRVGAAQDMLTHGHSLAQIMQRGGWKKPETVARYVELTDLMTM